MKLIILMILLSIACKNSESPGSSPKRLPSFRMALTDSIGVIQTNKIPSGKKILLIYFSPDCEHCHEQAKMITKGRQAITDYQIYFLSLASFSEIRKFEEYFQLKSYKNIRVAKDIDNSFFKFDKTPTFPLVVAYDEDKKLKAIFKGAYNTDKITKAMDQ